MTRSPLHFLKGFPVRMLAQVACVIGASAVSCKKQEVKAAVIPTVTVVHEAPKPPPLPEVKKDPLPEPEKKQPMIVETAPVSPKPVESKPKVDEPGPIELGKGPGSDRYGPGGPGEKGGTGPGMEEGVIGSPFGWYAGQVQTTITSALARNATTRSATFGIRVAIWVDSTGRVTKAKLIGSTGSQGLDQTIRSEILPGIQLAEAPPVAMPMPIQLRLNVTKQG